MSSKILTETDIAGAQKIAEAANKRISNVLGTGYGQDVKGDFNGINYLETDSVRRAETEMRIAKTIGTTLVQVYPNRQWGVAVDTTGGIVTVTCPSVSLVKGYIIHMADRTVHQLTERAKMAAGEILERYALSRARKFDDDIIETLDRDFRDEAIGPDSAPEPI